MSKVFTYVPKRTRSLSTRVSLRKTTVRPIRLALPLRRNAGEAEPEPDPPLPPSSSAGASAIRKVAGKSSLSARRSLTFTSSRKSSRRSSPHHVSQNGSGRAVDDQVSLKKQHDSSNMAAGSRGAPSLMRSGSRRAVDDQVPLEKQHGSSNLTTGSRGAPSLMRSRSRSAVDDQIPLEEQHDSSNLAAGSRGAPSFVRSRSRSAVDDQVPLEKQHDSSNLAAGSRGAPSLMRSGSLVASEVAQSRSFHTQSSRPDGASRKSFWDRQQPGKRKQPDADLLSPIAPPVPKLWSTFPKSAAVLQSTPIAGLLAHKSRETNLRPPHLVDLRKEGGTFVSFRRNEGSQEGSPKGHSSLLRSHSSNTAKKGGLPIQEKSLPEDPIPAGVEADQSRAAASSVQKGSSEQPPHELQQSEDGVDVVLENDSGVGRCLTVLRDTFTEKIAQAKSKAAKNALSRFYAKVEEDVMKILKGIERYHQTWDDINKEKRRVVALCLEHDAVEQDIFSFAVAHNIPFNALKLQRDNI